MSDCVSPKYPISFENFCTLTAGCIQQTVFVDTLVGRTDCDNKVAVVAINKVSSFNEYFNILNGRTIVIQKNNYFSLEFTAYPCGCPGVDFDLHVDVTNISDGFKVTNSVEKPNYVLFEGVFPAGTSIELHTNPYKLKYFSSLELRGKIGVSDAAAELKVVNAYDAATKVIYVGASGRPTTWSPPYPPPNNIIFPPVGQNTLLPDQYPTSNTTYPWTVSIIPSEFDQPIPPPLQGQVSVPFVPPKPNPVNIIADKFNKRNSVPRVIYYYVGDNPVIQCPNDSNISIFLKNLANRGPDNALKKQYMYAVTIDKLKFYQEKIETFINTVYSKVVIYDKPLVSAFREEFINFFLRIHIGDDDYPQYVIDYFLTFMDVIANGNPDEPGFDLDLMFGRVTIEKVLAYYKERVRIIKETKDESTIVYWWNVAGFPDETNVHESVHNIVAFSQFINSAYSIAVATTPEGKTISPALPPGSNTFQNYFQNYKNAATPAARVNVVRESMRILVPNAASFSDAEMKEHPGVRVQSRHIHQQIMIDNQSGPDNGTRTVQYFQNKTSYPGYDNVNLDYDYVHDKVKTIENWSESTFTSPVDQETVSDRVDLSIQESDAQLIPVFPKPTYLTFGVGYRACAAQSFSLYLVGRFLYRFADVEWEYRLPGTNYKKIALGPFKTVYDNVFAKK